MSGTVVGNMFLKYWKQKNSRGTRSFLNPVIQNKSHVREVKRLFWFMWCSKRVCFPVVVFAGSVELKGWLPKNVLRKEELIPYILSKKKVVFSESRTKKIFEKIKSKNIKGDAARKEHVRYVENMKSRF